MKGTGWLRQAPDFRDHLLESGTLQESHVTAHTVRDYFVDKVQDQGDLGSCVWNGIGSMMRWERSLLGLPDFASSRLFGYYFTRAYRHWEESDTGCVIRDAMLILDADGIIPEEDWPYDDGPTQFKVRPPQTLLHKALSNTIDSIGVNNKDASNLRYLRIPDASDGADPIYRIIKCIDAGHPVVAGYSLYSSFDSDRTINTGEVSMPKSDEKFIGGHLMEIVDYDQAAQTLTNLNSWDYSWGDKGFCHVPFAYYTNGLAVDLWTVRPKGIV